MNLFWRSLFVFFFSKFSPACDIFTETTIKLRVLPTDIDVLWHMNNGRYLSIMDLGRINLMVRTKFTKLLAQHGLYPVIASEMIRFKQSIGFMQKYILTTKILGWDTKFFYVEHSFKMKEKLCALAIVKVRFLARVKTNSLTPQMVLDIAGLNVASPQLPEYVNAWNDADQAFYASKTTLS